MGPIGDSSKPSNSWHAFSSRTQPNQETERLTMPERGDLTRLGAWIGGWNGTCRVRLGVWSAAFELLGQTDEIVVANEGSGGPSGGNVQQIEADLPTPVRLAAGASFYVGFSRHPSDGHQVSAGGSASGPHYEGKSGEPNWPTPNQLGSSGGVTEESRRIGAYVATYERVPGARVYRAGVATDAEAVQVMRSSVWQDADAVQVMRSSVWQDAQ